ncbi:MAG: Bifunctional ligase/repressor BirA [Syntrophaceae bacterium PtaU1.Bin231]|nr:MAG: Bifunctional ligase/repressor BirA [Syntrophaceae bacterium PtaU1.Bin231]
MDLTEQALKDRLGGIPGGWNARFFPALASTNETAFQLGREGAPDRTAVFADSQSRGRGRMKRVWQSPPARNLYVSLLLRPPLAAEELSSFPLVAGVAAARALLPHAGKGSVRLKWPNDVLLRGRKAAGILAEMRTRKKRVDFVVVGIGINVNMETADFDPAIRDKATSVREVTGWRLSRLELAVDLLRAFEGCYERFLREGFRSLREEWLGSTDMVGQRVRVSLENDVCCGIAETIDRDGALVIRDEQGLMRRMTIGDATVLKD